MMKNLKHLAPADEPHLRRALALARNGLLSAAPNPRVGCVIRRDGQTIGEGWHRRAGEAHAEIAAMQAAGCDPCASGALRGASVYVSMEPCAHTGRTASCARALAEAQPDFVAAAMPDPDPRTAGRGFEILRKSGIQVRCAASGSNIFKNALDLNLGFVSQATRNRPWLRMKIAATLDGKTALSSGLSRWITGEEARQDVHLLRARSCAIITGIGTALSDNPQLTARNVIAPRQPLRVLVDRDLRANPKMQMLAGGALIATARSDSAGKQKNFSDKVEILSLPGESGKVDLEELLMQLAARGVNEATTEAGRRLCGAFAALGLADEIVLYQAPSAFGSGFGMLEMPPPASPQEAMQFKLMSVAPIGSDLKIVYERPQSRTDLENATARAIA